MKRILIAGALALAAGGQALAADLPPGPMPPRAPATYVPVAVPYYNWGGIYLGINGGYDGFGNSNWTNGPLATSTGSFSTKGFLGGGTLGANFQAGAFVFGVEGDLDWDNISGTSVAGCGFGAGAGISCQTQQNWLGTARGRVGYAFDRILIYATGGGAFGNIKGTINGSTPPLGTSSNTEFGWTAGAGIEYALAQNWTAKVEYLFVDFANGSFGIPAMGGPAPFPATTAAISLNENIVRAGVNYKFNF